MRSDHRAVLIRHRNFSPHLFSVTFRAPALAKEIAPGQFVMMELPGRIRPYLRRAYSVADADAESGEVEFLIKTIGVGTGALESLSEGSVVNLLGPLGNGFGLEGLSGGARVAAVAGGIGAAPFPLLFRRLAAHGVAGDFFLGSRGKSDLALLERFDGRVTGKTFLTTDDGSEGERGFVTEAFRRRASSIRYDRLFACGPRSMFAALAPIVAELAIASQFSTEAEMGCGFGACLGCVLPGREKPFIVSCTEGPILAPERVRWV